MLIMAARLKWIYWDVAQSFSLRLAITVFTIILVYSVGQMNVVSLSNLEFVHDLTLLFNLNSLHVSVTRHARLISRQPLKIFLILTVIGAVHFHSTSLSRPLSLSFAFQYF